MEQGSLSLTVKRSLVVIYGGNDRNSCGYCGEGPSQSWGVCSPQMNARHYVALLCLGWRRCGSYYYRPANTTTCCPSYPIRLEASKFRPTKSQRKTLRKMTNYVASLEGTLEKIVDKDGTTYPEDDASAKEGKNSYE